MIRSFVSRSGRITASQKRAREKLWSQYGINLDKKVLKLEEIFGRSNPKHLEIGFGMGDALISMAKHNPEHDFLGIDVYNAGIGHLLIELEAAQLTNVKIICADAVEILTHYLPSECLDYVYIFFPDPWPKKRHHKRRLIQTEFLKLLATVMKLDTELYIATDWQHYAEHINEVLEATPLFNGGFIPRPDIRPLTKFEQRGLKLGHKVWDFKYQISK
jgi:tRNA (guanine-N7-)-methyltransferase